MRASKSKIFVRATAFVFVGYMMMSWAWNSATETSFWQSWEMAISAVLSVAFFGGLAWLITNVGMGLLFGGNPEYQAYRNSGGDPFFDSLPRVFNPDSQTVWQTEMDEPQMNFDPSASWQFCCPQCGARVEKRIDICWHCNYGADSDNSAYLQRHGNVKPPELSDEQWSRVLNGEPVNRNES